MLWGATGGEDEPRETGWPQRAHGWAPLAPWQGAAARPRARAAVRHGWRPWRALAVAAVQGRSWEQRAALCDGGGEADATAALGLG